MTPLERHADEQAAGNDRGAAPYVGDRGVETANAARKIIRWGIDEARVRDAMYEEASRIGIESDLSNDEINALEIAIEDDIAVLLSNMASLASAEAEADRLALDAARGEVGRLRAGIEAVADELTRDCEYHEAREIDPAEIRASAGWKNVHDYAQDLRSLLTSRPTDTEDPR